MPEVTPFLEVILTSSLFRMQTRELTEKNVHPGKVSQASLQAENEEEATIFKSPPENSRSL